VKLYKQGLYKPDKNWYMAEVLKLTGIAAITAYCFYNSLWGVMLGIPVALYLFRQDYEVFQKKCRNNFIDGFREMMQLVDSSISAGYSLENAFIEAGRECIKREAVHMQGVFMYIENGLGCNRRLEELLAEVGEKRRAEEITDLAGLIEIAKQHGGDISGLIRQFNQNISRRRMLEQELDTMMAAKRFEGMIMVVMPYLIILYMKMTTPGYMDVLYETMVGRLAMTGALIITVGAMLIMNKIVESNEI
jgi:tight adherence protein B